MDLNSVRISSIGDLVLSVSYSLYGKIAEENADKIARENYFNVSTRLQDPAMKVIYYTGFSGYNDNKIKETLTSWRKKYYKDCTIKDNEIRNILKYVDTQCESSGCSLEEWWKSQTDTEVLGALLDQVAGGKANG